jgi:Ala-tRNA(Pro) deacylase
MTDMTSTSTYTRLITFLDQRGARYRLIDHEPEGRTEAVSPMRGNALSQAAKCIVLMVKIGKKVTRYVLGVVPGDARVDLNAVKALLRGSYVSFASSDIAERLAGSVAGTTLPFSFNPELELIVDPSLLENDELYFNAARLDHSMVLKTTDYVALAKPRLERIVASRRTSPDVADGPYGPQPAGLRVRRTGDGARLRASSPR